MEFYTNIFYQMLSEKGIEEYFDKYMEKMYIQSPKSIFT